MSRNEIMAAIILVSVFVLFITSKYHKLPDAAVCLAATFTFFLFGILDPKEFSTGVSWDLIMFIAMALSLSAIFDATGISVWLSDIIVPAFAPIASSPWTFMLVITVIMFIWRFVDVAIFIPTMAIIVPLLPAIQETYGINPLIWIVIFLMAGNCFFMAYTNMWAVMSASIAGERSWKDSHLGIYGILYFVACCVAVLIAMPIWINIGMF